METAIYALVMIVIAAAASWLCVETYDRLISVYRRIKSKIKTNQSKEVE